jgi:hypothetical protein
MQSSAQRGLVHVKLTGVISIDRLPLSFELDLVCVNEVQHLRYDYQLTESSYYRFNYSRHSPHLNPTARFESNLRSRHAKPQAGTRLFTGAGRRQYILAPFGDRRDWLPVRRPHPTTAPGTLIPAPPRICELTKDWSCHIRSH